MIVLMMVMMPSVIAPIRIRGAIPPGAVSAIPAAALMTPAMLRLTPQDSTAKTNKQENQEGVLETRCHTTLLSIRILTPVQTPCRRAGRTRLLSREYPGSAEKKSEIQGLCPYLARLAWQSRIGDR